MELEPLRFGVSRAKLRPGEDLQLRFRTGARTVRWRLGDGAWMRGVFSGEGGHDVTLRLPQLSGPRRLTFDARLRQGGSARFALRLVPRD